MKRILSAVLIAFALSTSCATIPVVKDCSAEAAVGLIDDVNTALATDRYRDALSDLVSRFGGCVIEKAVTAVLDKIGIRAQYDSLEAQKQQRAKEWLAERGK